MKAAVICNGEIRDYSYIKSFLDNIGLVVCCDGGLRHCEGLGIFPDIICGDFDSVRPDVMDRYKNSSAEIRKVPREKDFTDGELGIRLALERGADELVLLGCLGSRFDHSLANVQLLLLPLKQGARAKIISENNTLFLVDRELKLDVEKGTTISLIPLVGEVRGVTTEGLYYPLEKSALSLGSSLGISNVSTGRKVRISLDEGLLLVAEARDDQ